MNRSKLAKNWLQYASIHWPVPRASQIVHFVGHAYRCCPLHAGHVMLMRTTGLAFVGKGRQQHINAAPSLLRYKLNYADTVHGVCALESSSFVVVLCLITVIMSIMLFVWSSS